ncbi:MAG: tyrosine-type recombinase/integrase [Pseudomonadota bacterium]|nr:tyrosine-type recombinase/integrase [Pseudomonadota bacterium]
MKRFESFLAPHLEQYLAYRQSLGYARRPTVSYLRTFDRYLQGKKREWALLQPSFFLELRAKLTLAPRSVNEVLSATRGFFQYLVRQEYYPENPLQDVPPLPQNAFIPFVFSPEQIEQLLRAACKRLRKTPKHLAIDLAIYLALVLLVRCGMRISEPLRLLHHHYQPKEKTLYIEKTKFKKDRLIPIPDSVAVEIENYLAVRTSFSLADHYNPFLLAGKWQKPLRGDQVRSAFHKAVKDIGLNQPRRILGNTNFSAPTPHSLRHSFAVNTLKRIKAQGKSPQNALPVLATYMGHSEYKYTAKYLKVLDAEKRQGLVDFAASHKDIL